MTRKVGICGSGTFPLTTPVAAQVVEAMREFDEDTLFLTRGSGPFELFVSMVALALGQRCFTYAGKGGAWNWERDAELVADADEVLAFLDPALLEAKTGTAHVIECALAAKKPVRVATVAAGTLVWEGAA